MKQTRINLLLHLGLLGFFLTGCSTPPSERKVSFHPSALSDDVTELAAEFRERDRSATAQDWSTLVDALPCNFRGTDSPQFLVLEPDLLAILGEPDTRSDLPDGSIALDYIVGYRFRAGDREETRLSVMLAADRSCRCLTTIQKDRTR